MNESKISVRYSKALFGSALDSGIVDKVRADMKYLLELTSLKDVREMIDSPVIENQVKRRTFKALLSGKVEEVTQRMVALTVDNNRESFIPGIARCFIDLADIHHGITKATLTTAVQLSDDVLKQFREMIGKELNTKIDLEERIDPDITGGFQLKIEDKYIDASVRTQLRKIGKELATN